MVVIFFLEDEVSIFCISVLIRCSSGIQSEVVSYCIILYFILYSAQWGCLFYCRPAWSRSLTLAHLGLRCVCRVVLDCDVTNATVLSRPHANHAQQSCSVPCCNN